jgi:hypothetical protein
VNQLPVDTRSAAWRKSSYSGGAGSSNCVEVASTGHRLVAVRDSKNPSGAQLGLSSMQWRALLDQVKNGMCEV